MSCAGTPARVVADFFAFPGSDAQTLRNGSFVAAGDVTGDGFADLICGGGGSDLVWQQGLWAPLHSSGCALG